MCCELVNEGALELKLNSFLILYKIKNMLVWTNWVVQSSNNMWVNDLRSVAYAR